MTTRNALVTIGEGGKYGHIFDNMDFNKQDYVAPTEDEQFEKEREQQNAHLADFFDLGGGANEEIISRFMFDQEQETEVINAEKLVEDAEDELDVISEKEREKDFEERQFVYKRDAAQREDLIEPAWSNSSDQVVNANRPSYSDMTQRSSERLRSTSSSSAATGSSATTGSSSASGSAQRGTRKAMDEFQRMNANVQRLGTQRTNGWTDYKETEEEYFSQFAKNTPFWKRGIRKVRNFLKSGKGRITMKMGIVIALQMAMAVFGKKYEFESMGQMAMMFSLMLASFFMTRELSGEGLDVSGMIF